MIFNNNEIKFATNFDLVNRPLQKPERPFSTLNLNVSCDNHSVE